MGSTESKVDKPLLEREYRLVRRFLSEFYAGTEVTVIEHKQTKQQFVLKEFVQQFDSQKLLRELQTHSNLSHRNLVQLRKYWIENDINICSSLFKVYAIFQYYENTLDECLNQEKVELCSDKEVADFARQILSALAFLERNRIFYLLSGTKSIALTYEQQSILKEHRQLRQMDSYRSSLSKNLQDRIQCPRNGMGHLNNNLINMKNESNDRCSLNKQMQENGKEKKKKVYKLFDPLEGLSASRSVHNLDSYMQVPMHPRLASVTGDHMLLSDSLIKVQNVFTVAMIALTMCQGCEVFGLDIFKNGKLSIQKFSEKITQLKTTHPKTAKELLRSLAGPHHLEYPFRLSHGLKINDSVIIKARQGRKSKENLLIQEQKQNYQRGEKLEQMKKRQKLKVEMSGRTSYKRLSIIQG